MLYQTIVAALTAVPVFCAPQNVLSNRQFQSPERSSEHHVKCSSKNPLSCSLNANLEDDCCYDGTNGLFLSTQFWDYYPATGANDTFTLHGLWSDKCNGGYSQFCNPGWSINDATSSLKTLGSEYEKLVDEMAEVWKNNQGSDDSLWTHEFNKHGTCMSTVNPKCYSSDSPTFQYVGDFYNTSVTLWKALPTFEFLEQAGISPSVDKTFTLKEFNDVLSSHVNGVKVRLGCDRKNALQEIWYFFYLQGSVATGEFIPTDSFTIDSCKDGFHWFPKGHNSGGGGGDDGKPTWKGYLKLSDQPGCLISNGKWYTSGTCATFSYKESNFGVTLRSSKGPCQIIDGEFNCASGNEATQFTNTDGNIFYGGEDTWTASGVPKASQQVPISPQSEGKGPVEFKLQFIAK